MPFTIPNSPAVTYPAQAEPDTGDFRIIVDGITDYGVASGCAVSAQTSPDMTVLVDGGQVKTGGGVYTITRQNATIGANSSGNPRIDLITVTSAGALAVVAGTAAAGPVFPTIPAGSIVLAAVYVQNGAATIVAANITDKRILIASDLPVLSARDFGARGDGKTVTDAVIATTGNHFTSATAGLTALDVGKHIEVTGGRLARPEIQTLTVTATGGTFTLSFAGRTTVAIPFNDSAANVQTALRNLSSIPDDGINTSGTLAGGMTLTFASTQANFPRPMITINTGSLTGGGTNTVVRTQAGQNNVHTTTIATVVSATQATLTAAPTAAVASGGTVFYGTDDTTAIQSLMTALRTMVGSGVGYFPQGKYITADDLRQPGNSWLRGDGIDLTEIRLKGGDLSYTTGASSNNGWQMVTSYAASQQNMRISDMTFNQNQANTGLIGDQHTVGAAPGLARSHVLDITDASRVVIERIRVINALKWSIHLQGCSDYTVTGCQVTTGGTSGLHDQQDGIHSTNCVRGTVAYNIVDTGITGDGDDCIVVRATGVGGNCADISIVGNIVRSGQRSFALVSDAQQTASSGAPTFAGGKVENIAISGNSSYYSFNSAVILNYYTYGGIFRNVSITGNTFKDFSNTSGHGIQIQKQADGTTPYDGFEGVTITGNSFRTMVTTTVAGIGVERGRGLVIASNVMSDMRGNRGIAFFDNTPANGANPPVSDFAITGNRMDLSAQPVAGFGILLGKCNDGIVANNVIIGPSGSTAAAIQLTGDATNQATDITVTGNRFQTWATGINESTTNVDFNAFIDNNFRSVTTPIVKLGTSTIYHGNRSSTSAGKWYLNGGAGLSQFLIGSTTWDPATISAGGQASTTVTVTGAALGDFALASMSVSTLTMNLTAQVTAANTVTVVLANESAGASQNVASGTLTVLVIKASA